MVTGLLSGVRGKGGEGFDASHWKGKKRRWKKLNAVAMTCREGKGGKLRATFMARGGGAAPIFPLRMEKEGKECQNYRTLGRKRGKRGEQ